METETKPKMHEITSKAGMKFYLPDDTSHQSSAVEADCLVYGPTGDKFVRHLVDRNESITSLVVKYDTEEDLIRRYNRTMIFDHLDNLHGDFIFIPVQKNWNLQLQLPSNVRDDRWKQLMIAKFCEHIGKVVKAAEAEFYLDESEWDIVAAAKLWREDESWEHSAEAVAIKQERAEGKVPTAYPAEADTLLGSSQKPASVAPRDSKVRRRQAAKRLESTGTELGVLK